MLDPKAKKILFKTYWTSAGWIDKQNRQIDKTDFEYAKEKGLMFDPLTITETELVNKLQEIVDTISFKKITDAFLSSLTNKRLDWSSALGSYANAQYLLAKSSRSGHYFYWDYGSDKDLNVLNFERIKWGGVRHNMGLYNWLDLTLLERDYVSSPTEEDVQIMQSILNAIDNSPIGETPGKLRERLKQIFDGSKNERSIMMDILGCVGILEPLDSNRKAGANGDWNFVSQWRGEDKYNKEMVKKYFGKYGIK